jgi:hypothetical protein
VKLPQVHAVHHHAAGVNVVETLDQAEHGRLARATVADLGAVRQRHGEARATAIEVAATHQRNAAPRLDVQVQPAEHGSLHAHHE